LARFAAPAAFRGTQLAYLWLIGTSCHLTVNKKTTLPAFTKGNVGPQKHFAGLAVKRWIISRIW
jgi:hypothetical protein